MNAEELEAFKPAEPYVPFSADAERLHADRFRGCTDLIMERIAGLLDERHLPSMTEEHVDDGRRFV